MATTITVGNITYSAIEGSDNIAGSREILNSNFNVLAEGINTYEKYVNTGDGSINCTNINIKKGSNQISDTLLTTNGSINAGGNLNVGLNITANSSKIKNNVEIEVGNLTLNNPDSITEINGKLKLGGELILSDFGNQYINAADKQTYTSNNWSNLITDSANNIIGGLVSLSGTNSIILDFSSYTGTERYFIDKIKFNTENITIGQKVLIVVLVGSNTSHEFTLMKDTIKSYIDLTAGVIFNKSYQTLEIIFDGTNWVVTNLIGATLR